MNNGCAFGRETRQMVKDMKESVTEIKENVNRLTNHYSKRLPGWATILLSILAALCSGLTIALLK